MAFFKPHLPRKALKTIRKVYQDEMAKEGVEHYKELSPGMHRKVRETSRKRIRKQNVAVRIVVYLIYLVVVVLVVMGILLLL